MDRHTHTHTHTDRHLDPQHTQKNLRPPTQSQAIGTCPPQRAHTHTHTRLLSTSAPLLGIHLPRSSWRPQQLPAQAETQRHELPALPQAANLPIRTSLPEPVPPLGPWRWRGDPESPSTPVDTCPRPLPLYSSPPLYPSSKGRMLSLFPTPVSPEEPLPAPSFLPPLAEG